MLRSFIFLICGFFLLTSCQHNSSYLKATGETTSSLNEINADLYIYENYELATFRELLTLTSKTKLPEDNINYYESEIQQILEFSADQSKKNFHFKENKVKILFDIEKSFSILGGSLNHCREFSQKFSNYDLSFSHTGLACRDDSGYWHLLKRKT